MSAHDDQLPDDLPDYGLLAQYDDVTSLAKACEKVRDEGYQFWDSHSPFPVHGIDPAMGIKMTKLPWLIFFAGIAGTCTAIGMQWWMNAVDYQFLISGKPMFSLPANIPVAFELTVLFAALTTFFATLAVNGFPKWHSPLFNSERFARVTDDKFFISIRATDSKYDPDMTRQLLEGTGAVHIETVPDDTQHNAKFPMWVIYLGIVGFVAGFVPLGIAAKARVSKSPEPRIHLNPNMDFQEKFKAQSGNVIFADGRSMRTNPSGTVGEGMLKADHHMYRGLTEQGAWATTLPKQVEANMDNMQRGKERFEIYCAPCHGAAGYGDGPVHRRASGLGEGTWVQPSSLHTDNVKGQPVGKLYDTISNGIRNMPGYAAMIPEDDRWRIVMYIRALQKSQNLASR